MQTIRATAENIGQISSMTMPENFARGGRLDNVVGDSSLHSYYLRNDPEVRICLFYRGYGINERAAEQFQQTLEDPPKELSRTDIDRLSDLFGEKANTQLFSIAGARTETINNVPLLVMEGSYPGLAERNCTVYIDADGTGRFVQEVFFQAPADKYMSYYQQFTESLASIQWA